MNTPENNDPDKEVLLKLLEVQATIIGLKELLLYKRDAEIEELEARLEQQSKISFTNISYN